MQLDLLSFMREHDDMDRNLKDLGLFYQYLHTCKLKPYSCVYNSR